MNERKPDDHRKGLTISKGVYKPTSDWVKENYGFTIKTCWIAHVKEMCGLNPTKAANRLDPTKRANPCPAQKIEPIKEAFRVLGII